MKKQKNLYEKTFNAIWNQYMLLYSSRNRMEHRFEILLLLSGILFAAFINLNLVSKSSINYISLFGFCIIFILALWNMIIPRSIIVPWVEKEDFIKKMDSEKIHKQLIDEIYTHVTEIRKIERFYSNTLELSILLLVISISIPFLVVLESIKYILSILGLVGLIIFLIFIDLRFQNSKIKLLFKKMTDLVTRNKKTI